MVLAMVVTHLEKSLPNISAVRCTEVTAVIQAASTCFPLDARIPALQVNIANTKHTLGNTERLEAFQAVADKLQVADEEKKANHTSYSADLHQALLGAKGVTGSGCLGIMEHTGVKAWVDKAMDEILNAISEGKESTDKLGSTFDAFDVMSDFCEQQHKPHRRLDCHCRYLAQIGQH